MLCEGLPRADCWGPQHRYTLTEGDFHHLKNARLTHLHLPPLKIATIHECDSGEASAAATPHPATTSKDSLAIFQVRSRLQLPVVFSRSWKAGVGRWDRPSPTCTLCPSSLTNLSVHSPLGKPSPATQSAPAPPCQEVPTTPWTSQRSAPQPPVTLGRAFR